MKKLFTLFFIVVIVANMAVAQIAVNITGSRADGSAMLDVESTNKGFLPPRMTAAQRAIIESPATGLLVYQTDAPAGYYFYTGAAWELLGTTPDATTSTLGKIMLTGDLGGTATSPTVQGLSDKVDKVAGSSLIDDASIARLANTSGTNTGDQTSITGNAGTATTLTGLTATIAELNKLDGFTGNYINLNYAKGLYDTGVTTAEFDKLDGLIPTVTELNYVDGVTSSIQNQLNGKLSTSGTAAKATALETSRTLSLTGDVSGNVLFDGSANVSITTTVANNSHTHTGSTILNLDGELITSGVISDLRLPATISSDITGNAATATILKTSRTINGVSFNGSKNITVYDATKLPTSGGTMTGGLVINGSDSHYINNYNWLNVNQNTIGYSSSGTFNYSLYATDRIAATEFNAYSDRRIKTDIKPIGNSLEIIKKLQPSSYTKIDKVHYGNGLHYGFIAQELEQVIPQAVTQGKGEVPVLQKFENATLEDGVTYVLEVSKNGNITRQDYNKTQPRPEGDVFVINKKINDFRTVDYNMVFTIAVAALQEQQKEIESQNEKIKTLENEIADIKEAIRLLNTNK